MGKNINKLIACILLIPCISVLFSCKHSDLDDDSVYTNNVKSVSDIKNGFKYLGYIFYTDENGRSAIAQIDYENNIVKNQSYNKVKVNEQSFKKVKNGMNPFDVVKLVGIPFRSVTSGLITLDFKCDDGTVYRIGWSQVHNSENQNAKFTDLEVNEVYKVTE